MSTSLKKKKKNSTNDKLFIFVLESVSILV